MIRRRATASEIARLKSLDSEFNTEELLTRFRTAFLKIQDSWSDQNLEGIRPLVSDGVYERFSLQIEEQKDFGYRNVVEDVKILDVAISEVDTESLFEVVVVSVAASAVDYRVDLNDGVLLWGQRKESESFVECWTLLRRRGVRSVSSDHGLLEGNCPNCASPLRLNRHGSCEACDALVTNGEYDWVLSEITQAEVWKPLNSHEKALVNRYRSVVDPGFSIQHLTDRASIIFWRRAMSDRLAKIDPLSKMATEKFSQHYAGRFKSKRTNRKYRGNCSVGVIRLLGILQDKDCDRVLVEAHFSSHLFETRHSGHTEDLGDWQRRREMFVLRRRRGVETNVERSLQSAHCAKCGGPETALASHTCEFCGEILTEGDREWVLEAIHSFKSDAAKRLRNKANSQRISGVAKPRSAPSLTADTNQRDDELLDPLDTLTWMLKVVSVDGSIHERERKQLDHLAHTLGVSEESLNHLIDADQRDGLDSPELSDKKSAYSWFTQMATMAAADGEIMKEERLLLNQVGRRAGLKRSRINLIVTKKVAAAKRRAKSAKH